MHSFVRDILKSEQDSVKFLLVFRTRLTPADGCDDAVGSEVSTSEPASQLTQFNVHQSLFSYGNCSQVEIERTVI